jgi:hypothetical protein
MDTTLKASMTSGPKLYSFRDNLYFYGACHNLSFGKEEVGKTLQVTVDTGNRPLCWIELWPGHYDGGDWVKWTEVRGKGRGQIPLVRTAERSQANPSLTWMIQAGDYTLYFVASSKTEKVKEETIEYHIQTTG